MKSWLDEIETKIGEIKMAMANLENENAILKRKLALTKEAHSEISAAIHESREASQAEAEAFAFESGCVAARNGVQEVVFDEYCNLDVPESWLEVPFCRIRWFEDRGDPSVGIPGTAGWTLADDQLGTTMEKLLIKAKEDDDEN